MYLLGTTGNLRSKRVFFITHSIQNVFIQLLVNVPELEGIKTIVIFMVD